MWFLWLKTFIIDTRQCRGTVLFYAGGNILLPWALRNAKISRAVWVTDSWRGRRRERAVPLRRWAKPVAQWPVAPKCSRPRSWPLFFAVPLDRWTPGNYIIITLFLNYEDKILFLFYFFRNTKSISHLTYPTFAALCPRIANIGYKFDFESLFLELTIKMIMEVFNVSLIRVSSLCFLV